MVKISVISCFRNNDKYIDYINKKFGYIEKKYKNYEFEYFIYENNSIDNTKEYLKKFYINRKGKYLSEDIVYDKIHSGINKTRGHFMAIIRNKLKSFHGKLNSDYTLIIDSDVVFKNSLIINLIKTIDKDIVMVNPFCICYGTYKKHKKIHYYDSLALISSDNISYSNNFNTCLFKYCSKCINKRKKYNINIDNNKLFDYNKLIQVKSSFGSCSLIKTDIYNKVHWSNSICEHHSFCKYVSKYGKIVINPLIKIVVGQSNNNELNDYIDIEKKIFKNIL